MPVSKYYKAKPTGDTGVNLAGLDELQDAMSEMLKDFPEEKLKLMNDVGDVLVKHIKPLTPIDYDPPDGSDNYPGRLRESIHKKVTSGYAVVKSGERYAHLVEAGHVIANRKVESGIITKRGKNKGRYKMRPQVLGFVRGKWMFKKGTALAMSEIRGLVDEFVKKVTYK